MKAVTPVALGTGSRTMADMLPLAAKRYADKPALRHKVDGEWMDVSFGELGDAVKEFALGLVDLGVEPGDKVAILSHTRPEWTYSFFGASCAGATGVSIYQTNSPEECHYVARHSEARAIIVEDQAQLAKIRQVRAELPRLEHVVVIDPQDAGIGDACSLAALRERGRRRDPAELDARVSSVTPTDICLYIYTSGTTGPPKGCVLSHRNYREITTITESQDVLREGDVTYLFLPLAHAFALLVQFVSIDLGGTIAYWERDPQRIVPNLMEVKPTYFPSVPRMFEKIYALATGGTDDPERLRRAIALGLEVRGLRARGEPVRPELEEAFAQADEELFSNVRNLFGGRIRQCVTGAAPIAREILEFFYACGVPVMEGYGMTETATVATVNSPATFRFGSVGRPLPGVEVRIADDGEVLVRGPNVFEGYYKNEDATRETLDGDWLHTGDLGSLDEDGFLFITGRKKDIIITAGGKNIAPANLENDLKRSRLISHAVVVGDRRPYLVALITLDPEELLAFAQAHGLELSDAGSSVEMRAAIERVVDAVNARVGRVEQIKRFAILEHDLSQEDGELTPTLKVKRNVVADKYANVIDELYATGER